MRALGGLQNPPGSRALSRGERPGGWKVPGGSVEVSWAGLLQLKLSPELSWRRSACPCWKRLLFFKQRQFNPKYFPGCVITTTCTVNAASAGQKAPGTEKPLSQNLPRTHRTSYKALPVQNPQELHFNIKLQALCRFKNVFLPLPMLARWPSSLQTHPEHSLPSYRTR